MERQVIRNEILGEEYYHYRHASGLQILLYPMTGYQSAYALFATNYGSIDTTFRTEKETDFVTVPEGIAHFLEHKLFESEDGDAFSLFAKTGASANAYTSFDKTCYLFSTTDNFEESLRALMTFVQHPYFTKETVEKEQGIIGQEIRMYEDDPNWRVMFNLLGALYHNNPVRIDIAGTADSIAKIDDQLLYRCYNTFYNLSNMAVCIAGNFDETKAATLIEESLKEVEKCTVTVQTPPEPEEIRTDYTEQKLSVAVPLFHVGFKEIPVSKEEELATQLRLELILNAFAGKGSTLYQEMYEESLINSTFGSEVFCGRGYCALLFGGESRNPKEVRDRIASAVEKLHREGLDAETFERVRRAMYGRTVLSFNEVDEVANGLVSSCFAGESFYAPLELLRTMTLEEVNDQLARSLDTSRMALSVILPA